jgi:hypothetical protein
MRSTGKFSLHFPLRRAMPKFIEPVVAKASPKRSFSMIENERFGLVFAKLGLKIRGLVYCIYCMQ